MFISKYTSKGFDVIAIISTTHAQGYGAEAILTSLLKTWKDKEMPLCIAAPPDSAAMLLAVSLGFMVVPLSTAKDCLYENTIALLRRAGDFKGCRLVHAWHGRGFEQAWLLSKMLGIPATGTLHDHPTASFHGIFRRRIMRLSANNGAGIVCVSQAVSDACRKEGYSCRLEVIRNGISALAKDVVPAGETAGLLRIGFMGMHKELKGFRVVERWIRQASTLDVQWRLYGETKEMYGKSVELLLQQYPGKVLMAGRKQASRIFSEIDLLVHPSVEFDAFPTVLLEAACCGIPVVASNIGGAAEIIDHGVTGFVYNSGDPEGGLHFVKMLIQDAAMRRDFGLAARRSFENKFVAERMTDDYRNYWASVLDKRTGKVS